MPEDQLIRKTVAHRAKEFGDRISHRDIRLDFMDLEIAPGCRIFHAFWGGGKAKRSFSGLLMDDETPDLFPAQALKKIFHRWLDVKGGLPDAGLMATVSAYIFDASSQHDVILCDGDKSAFITEHDWLPYIRLPEPIDVPERSGVIFWWVGPRGASRLRVQLDENGNIVTEEEFIQDLLKQGKGHEPT